MKQFFRKHILPLIVILAIGVGVLGLVVLLSGLALSLANAGDERLLYVCVAVLLPVLFFRYTLAFGRLVYRLFQSARQLFKP